MHDLIDGGAEVAKGLFAQAAALREENTNAAIANGHLLKFKNNQNGLPPPIEKATKAL